MENSQVLSNFQKEQHGQAVDKRRVESLIKAGAFSEFEQTRATLLTSLESILNTIINAERRSISGQIDVFGMNEDIKYNFTEMPEYAEKDLLSMEKEMLGIYISGHPLDKLRDIMEKATNINTKEIAKMEEENKLEKDGKQVKYGGIITSIKKKYTKNNTLIAFVTIEDLYGSREIIVFDSTYRKSGHLLVDENIVLVEGRLSIREDEEAKIVANNITMLNAPLQNNTPKNLTINITNLPEETKAKLRGMIKFFSGSQNNMPIQVVDGRRDKTMWHNISNRRNKKAI